MEFYVYREPKQSDNPKIIIWSNGYIIEREVWIGEIIFLPSSQPPSNIYRLG